VKKTILTGNVAGDKRSVSGFDDIGQPGELFFMVLRQRAHLGEDLRLTWNASRLKRVASRTHAPRSASSATICVSSASMRSRNAPSVAACGTYAGSVKRRTGLPAGSGSVEVESEVVMAVCNRRARTLGRRS
jgi:hypothetical protein